MNKLIFLRFHLCSNVNNLKEPDVAGEVGVEEEGGGEAAGDLPSLGVQQTIQPVTQNNFDRLVLMDQVSESFLPENL